MTWTNDWTVETVEQNYRALGMIDPEDIEQLLADAKELARLQSGSVIHDFDPSGDEHPPACMCPCCDQAEGKM